MDNRYKHLLYAKIKRTTLKATASAVLSLIADTALASDCPAEITGSILENSFCTFTSAQTGSSLTIENGGTVGGIITSTSPPLVADSITVNSGGVIYNQGTGTGTAIGIGIMISPSSVLAQNLTNNGTITATNNMSIRVTHGTIDGGMINTGTIHSLRTTAISITSNAVLGSITNTGSIIAGNLDEVILISTNSSITGDILNSGLLQSDHGNGILIRRTSHIGGNFTNTGTIQAGVSGIAIATSLVQGNVINSGTITTLEDGLNRAAMKITNATTISGDITNTGTVNAYVDGISFYDQSTLAGSISNSGNIQANNAGLSVTFTSFIGGNITNSGTIHGGAEGIFVQSAARIANGVSNTGVISGGATGILVTTSGTISGGISHSGTIQGDIFALKLHGTTPALNVLGQTARIIGAVDAPNTNVNITSGAVFTTEGSYNVEGFEIAEKAVLNLGNSITTVNNMNNAGTLVLTDSVQTLTGNYIQATGGTFQTGVTSSTEYGQLVVSDNVDLSQSGDLSVQVQPNASLRPGEVIASVISAGNTLIAPDQGFQVSSNSYIWNFLASITDPGVDLTPVVNSAVYSVCQGTYCQGAADAIIAQVTTGNTAFSPYNLLTTADAWQTAASQATPELTNENIQIIQLITRAVVDIVPMWTQLRGKSAGDAAIYQPGKIWVKPYGASMTQDAKNTVNGFYATAYGGVIGRDQVFNDDGLVGAALAIGGDDMHGRSVLNGQSIYSNAYQGMLYGSKQFDNQIYVAGQVLGGYESSTTHRAIPLYGSTARGAYDSWFTNLRAEAGWSTDAWGPDWVVTPEVDASYLFINQGSYQESGSVMDLSVAAQNNNSLVLGAYGNVAYHLTTTQDQHTFNVTGYAGLAGDVLNSQPQTLATFVASGSSFSTFGVQFNGLVFRGGAGLTISSPMKPLTLELNYDLQVGNHAYSGIGAATIKYKE